MDQFASVLSREGCALFIDCTTRAFEHVPFDGEACLLVVDSGAKHALADGEYAARRAQCEEAARLLGVSSLRAASREQVEAALLRMPGSVALRRARHVCAENERTLRARDVLPRGDMAALGQLFVESHASLRDDFEVSCRELDLLVDLACALGEDVYGARMTGGGFGGSVIVLARTAARERVAALLREGYARQTSRATMPFAAYPVGGALVLRCSVP
jgi:galactokinase